MAETLRIEIPIETVDNTDPGVSNATKKFEKMERAANSANSSAKKASDTVSKFDKQAQKTEKSLASWAKEKYEVLLEAKERISPVLSTLGNGLIEIWNNEEGPIARITVYIAGSGLAEDETVIDTNNCPWAMELIKQHGFGQATGRMVRSGYCTYPVVKLDIEKTGLLRKNRFSGLYAGEQQRQYPKIGRKNQEPAENEVPGNTGERE